MPAVIRTASRFPQYRECTGTLHLQCSPQRDGEKPPAHSSRAVFVAASSSTERCSTVTSGNVSTYFGHARHDAERSCLYIERDHLFEWRLPLHDNACLTMSLSRRRSGSRRKFSREQALHKVQLLDSPCTCPYRLALPVSDATPSAVVFERYYIRDSGSVKRCRSTSRQCSIPSEHRPHRIVTGFARMKAQQQFLQHSGAGMLC